MRPIGPRGSRGTIGMQRWHPPGEDLDDEPARCEELEGPRPMHPCWRIDLESILLQASIDLVDLLSAFLDEADVKRPRLFRFGRPIEVGQGLNHTVLVPQERDPVIPRVTVGIEPETLHEESPGLLDLRRSEVEVVQDHGW